MSIGNPLALRPFILFPDDEWESPQVPVTGGTFSGLGSLNVSLEIPAGTFSEPVVIRGRRVPPIGYTLAGLDATQYPGGALSLAAYTAADGKPLGGTLVRSIIVSFDPDPEYDPDLSTVSGFILDEGDLGHGGRQVPLGTAMVESGRIHIPVDHFSLYSIAATVAGGGQNAKLTSSLDICTPKTNGLIVCGVYRGGDVEITVGAGQVIGNLQSVMNAMAGKMSSSAIQATLSALTGGEVSTTGEVTLGSSIKMSAKNGMIVAGKCLSGELHVCLHSQVRNLSFGEQLGTVTIPLGLDTCINVDWDPQCCPPSGEPPVAGKQSPIKTKAFCCSQNNCTPGG